MTQDQITEAQRRLRPRPVVPETRADFRSIARWWELEATRGYKSSDRSRQYAASMRWVVELMDNGHKIDSQFRGLYIDGVLIGDYIRKNRHHAK